MPGIGLISPSTYVSKLAPLGVIGFLEQSLGNHGSAQIFRFLPSPTLQIIPFITSIPRNTLRQVYDIPALDLASNIDEFAKYFAFKNRAHKESRCFHSHQPCFASIMRLKSMNISESQTHFMFRFHHCVLTQPVNFVLPLLLVPLEPTYHRANLVT